VKVEDIRVLFGKAAPIASIKEKSTRNFDESVESEYKNYYILYADVASAQ